MEESTITFEGMTVIQGVNYIIKIWRKWCDNGARNFGTEFDYVIKNGGFGALHDLWDANMMLPFADDDIVWYGSQAEPHEGIRDDYTDYCNAVTTMFNSIFIEEVKPLKKEKTMKTYLIDLQERIEADSEDEVIVKFREIVATSEASIFDVDIVED